MEVSSTSMKVASITATATSQGLPPPGAEPLRAGCGVISFCPSLSPRKHVQMRGWGLRFQCCLGCQFTVGNGWKRSSAFERIWLRSEHPPYSLLPNHPPSYTRNVCPPPTGNLPATARTDLQSFRRHIYDDDDDGPARGQREQSMGITAGAF